MPATEDAIATPSPRRPRGEPLDGSDRAIERRAEVDAEDIAAAVALWHRAAPPKYRGLIDARAKTGGK